MKKPDLKTILGTALVLTALTNAQAKIPKKIKKATSQPETVFKINDKTNNQDSISDGTRSENASK